MDRYHYEQPVLHSKQREEVDEMDFTQAQSFVAERIGSINFGLIRQESYDLQTKKPNSIYSVQEMSSFKSLYKMQDIRNEAAKLERKYKWHLGIRGDGNCFYRSVIILYLIRMVESPDLLCKFINQVYKLTHIQSSLTSKGINCDDLKAIFLGFLQFLMEAKKEGYVDNFNNVIFFYNQLPEVDLAAIVITRFLIFKQLIQMKNDPNLRYFIEERMWKEGPDLILTYFECAEDIIISLAASAFSCNINVQHFYRSGGDNSNGFMNKYEQYKPQNKNSQAFISVLFLNGHYEALLGHNEDKFYQIELFNIKQAEDIVRKKMFFDLFNRDHVPVRTNNQKANLNKNSINRSSSVQARQSFVFNSEKIIQNDENQRGSNENIIDKKLPKNHFKQIDKSDDKIKEQGEVSQVYFTQQQNYFGKQQQNELLEQAQKSQFPIQGEKLQNNRRDNFSPLVDQNKQLKNYEPASFINQIRPEQKPYKEIESKQVKISHEQLNETNKTENDFDCYICHYVNIGGAKVYKKAKINLCDSCMVSVIKKSIDEKISEKTNLFQEEKKIIEIRINDPNIENIRKVDEGKKNKLNENFTQKEQNLVQNSLHEQEDLNRIQNTPKSTSTKTISCPIYQTQKQMSEQNNSTDRNSITQVQLKTQNLDHNAKGSQEFLLHGKKIMHQGSSMNCLFCKNNLNSQGCWLLEEKSTKQQYDICFNCKKNGIITKNTKQNFIITFQNIPKYKINEKKEGEIKKLNPSNPHTSNQNQQQQPDFNEPSNQQRNKAETKTNQTQNDIMNNNKRPSQKKETQIIKFLKNPNQKKKS